MGVLAEGKIVKADDTDLSGNGKALTLALLHNPPCQYIVAAYDGAAAAVQKPVQMHPDTFVHLLTQTGQVRIAGQLVAPDAPRRKSVEDLLTYR